MTSKTIIGIDFGKIDDPTALVAVRSPTAGMYEVAGAGRVPLGLSYTDTVGRLVAAIREVAYASTGSDIEVVADGTGVGVAVVDLLREQCDMPVVAVTFTAGNEASIDQPHYRGPVNASVPKVDLVTTTVVVAERGGLIIPDALAEADALRTELGNIERSVSAAGRQSFTHRSGTHDDLALALCCAVWWGQNRPVPPVERFAETDDSWVRTDTHNEWAPPRYL